VVLCQGTEEILASAIHLSFAWAWSHHDRDRKLEHRSLHLCDLVIGSGDLFDATACPLGVHSASVVAPWTLPWLILKVWERKDAKFADAIL
jgi:hypothetical protein